MLIGIQFWDNPFDPAHSLSIEVSDNLHIHLHTICTKVALNTRVPTADDLEKNEHVHMTSPHPWNPADVHMVQATHRGGSTPSTTWKHHIATVDSTNQFEYLVDVASDDIYLDSIDPSLVRLGKQLRQKHKRFASQVETIYVHTDTPGRRTFVSDERRVIVTAEMIAEKFGISIPRAQRTSRHRRCKVCYSTH